MRTSKSPSAYRRVAWTISRMGWTWRMAVMEDEFDTGARRKLNLGHSFGHAVEACSDFSIPHGCAVAIGSEGKGLSRELLECCDRTVLIPMRDHCESLNAAAAATVLLWEMARND